MDMKITVFLLLSRSMKYAITFMIHSIQIMHCTNSTQLKITVPISVFMLSVAVISITGNYDCTLGNHHTMECIYFENSLHQNRNELKRELLTGSTQLVIYDYTFLLTDEMMENLKLK